MKRKQFIEMEIEKRDNKPFSGPESEEEDDEVKHFKRIFNAFCYYRAHSLKRISRAENEFHLLPRRHRELLPNYAQRMQNLRMCIDHNQQVIYRILAHVNHMFENADNHSNGDVNHPAEPAAEFLMDKVKSTLKQVVRDWSRDGQAERDACYQPVIEEVERLFADSNRKRSDIHILVPGAGLGRLAWEFARRGFTCQGNEFSLFMLFTSNFILNICCEVEMLTLYPWVLQFSNTRRHADQTHAVRFPDVNPVDLPEISSDDDQISREDGQIPLFSMAAGDFIEVYTEPEQWDCVCTVFFIDTAHNVIEYIETIWKILKPGGYWINLGPLHYHFADMAAERSVEFTYEEVKQIVHKLNFTIVKEVDHMLAGYTGYDASMLRYQYDCGFFVARKPDPSADHCTLSDNRAANDVKNSAFSNHNEVQGCQQSLCNTSSSSASLDSGNQTKSSASYENGLNHYATESSSSGMVEHSKCEHSAQEEYATT